MHADFNNMLRVLNRQKPQRATLFEFYLNQGLEEILAGRELNANATGIDRLKLTIDAYFAAGYDYATVKGSGFAFNRLQHVGRTYSANSGAMITDWKSFEAYKWTDPESYDYSRLEVLRPYLKDGMKFIVYGQDGVLENVIGIVGFENLCIMLFDEPDLAAEIFKNVGERLIKYYEICLQFGSVGAIISNDDWGYNTGTMISPSDMRKYLFPYHRGITNAAIRQGKPVILHSCGKLDLVYDEIIDDMKYSAKHSNEDNILPIESAYLKYSDRIALVGGIDLNFLIRESEENIRKRCINMLDMSAEKGGYALGTGNSIPDYVPNEKYMAMIECVKEFR